MAGSVDISSYPTVYDPFDAPNSRKIKVSGPSQTINLTMRANGQRRSVNCIDIAIGCYKDCFEKKGEDLLRVVHSIVELLEATEEWKALPEYEFFYE